MFGILGRFFYRVGMVFRHPFFRKKITYESPVCHHPFAGKGSVIFVVSGAAGSDFGFFCSLFPGHTLHPLILKAGAFGLKERLFAGISSSDDCQSFLKKKRALLAFVQTEEDYGELLSFAQRYALPLCFLAQEKSRQATKRVLINIGERFLPSSEESSRRLIQRMNALMEQARLYDKYHAYGLFHFSDFILDFARLAVLPKMAFAYPVRYLYESPLAKKNRHLKGKGLAVANHVGFADAQMMPRIYPHRRLRMVVGDIVYRNNGKLMHFWLKEAHVIPVGDKQSDPSMSLAGFAQAIDLLKCNCLLGIFPEGEIHWDGQLGAFHDGVVALALLSGAKIYPSYTLYPHHPFHRQVVIIGEPFDCAKFSQGEKKLAKDNLAQLTALLEEKMRTLKAEALRQLAAKSR
jgi:1-acyl-sn-glycerol-3-phosphate acyltransferase